MRLKKEVNPIGTRHKIPTQTPTGISTPTYKVNRIIGDRMFVPSADILVELAYVAEHRSQHHFTPFLMLSLQTLASDGEPVSEADVFWIAEKTDMV